MRQVVAKGEKEDNKKIVTDYLWNYSNYKMRTALIDNEIQEVQMQIKAITGASIAKYGEDVGGGHNKTVDDKSAALIKCENRITKLTKEKQTLTSLLSKIDIVLEYLPEEQRLTLSHKYIHRKTWRQVSGELKTHVTSCRRIANKGIITVAAALSEHNTITLDRIYKAE